MAFTERIRLAIDVVTGDATGPLKNLSRELKETDGAFAKAKVGASGLFDLLKQNAATGALAAGTALAAFATKAVGEFQRTALGAGKLRDSLGVTAEEASRLQEVAGDVGIGVDSLSGAINRMNRAAASTPGVFEDIGASIKRNADGTVNVTETFLSVIDALNRIPDATKRADAAQKIFGRGWQQLAELVAIGADGVREALDSVEGGKIIDDSEIARAREFRDTLDDLKGTLESMTVAVGGAIVSTTQFLGDVEESVTNFEDKIESGLGAGVRASVGTDLLAAKARNAQESLNAMADAYLDSTNMVREHTEASEESAEAIEDEAQAFKDAADAAQESADAHQAEAEAILATVTARRSAADSQFALNDAQRSFADVLSGYNDLLADSETTMSDLAAAQDEAAQSAGAVADAALRVAQDQAAARGETLGAAQAGDVWRDSMLQQAAAASGPLQDAILSYLGSVEGIPPEKLTDIKAAIARGDLATAQKLLDEASETRTAEIEADAQTSQAETDLEDVRRKKRVADIVARAVTQAADEGLEGTRARRRVADIVAQALTSSANSDLGLTARQRSAIIAAVAQTGNAESALNSLARDRTTTIRVNTVRGLPLAVADGGITAFAGGGHRLPKYATIQPPVGSAGLVQWAEPETGGEAFIPLAGSKRRRSLEIWRRTGQLLGAMADGGLNGATTTGPVYHQSVTLNSTGATVADINAALLIARMAG